jgi:hypothetical protein
MSRFQQVYRLGARPIFSPSRGSKFDGVAQQVTLKLFKQTVDRNEKFGYIKYQVRKVRI